jgi:transcriptional regulator with XRE-family HTH domain
MIVVSFSYVSKIENEKIDFGNYPSEDLIRKIASVLEPELDEPLIRPKIVRIGSESGFWLAPTHSSSWRNWMIANSTG